MPKLQRAGESQEMVSVTLDEAGVDTVVCWIIEEGTSVSDVARTFNIHPATIYRCLDAARSRLYPQS